MCEKKAKPYDEFLDEEVPFIEATLKKAEVIPGEKLPIQMEYIIGPTPLTLERAVAIKRILKDYPNSVAFYLTKNRPKKHFFILESCHQEDPYKTGTLSALVFLAKFFLESFLGVKFGSSKNNFEDKPVTRKRFDVLIEPFHPSDEPYDEKALVVEDAKPGFIKPMRDYFARAKEGATLLTLENIDSLTAKA